MAMPSYLVLPLRVDRYLDLLVEVCLMGVGVARSRTVLSYQVLVL